MKFDELVQRLSVFPRKIQLLLVSALLLSCVGLFLFVRSSLAEREAASLARGGVQWCENYMLRPFRAVAKNQDYEGLTQATNNDLGSTYGGVAARAIQGIAQAVSRGGESAGLAEAADQAASVCKDEGFRAALASTDNG